MLVASKSLMRKARKKHYAIPSFNTVNLEISKAIFGAAERMNAPLMIQVTETTIAYAGLENIFATVQQLEKESNVPVSIHLDHGKHLPLIKKVIGLGFKSVMVDASNYSFNKNVAITKKVVSMARRKGCTVEAELGALKRIGSKGQQLTDPKEAKLFVEKSGCDALAIAIGTSHGAHKFRRKPELDFERLEEISELVSIPLVLHGASSVPKTLVQKCNRFGAKLTKTAGVPEKDLRKAIKFGVAKVNIDTDLRLAFTAGLRTYLSKNPKDFDPRKALSLAQLYTQEVCEHKLKVFGTKGNA